MIEPFISTGAIPGVDYASIIQTQTKQFSFLARNILNGSWGPGPLYKAAFRNPSPVNLANDRHALRWFWQGFDQVLCWSPGLRRGLQPNIPSFSIIDVWCWFRVEFLVIVSISTLSFYYVLLNFVNLLLINLARYRPWSHTNISSNEGGWGRTCS